MYTLHHSPGACSTAIIAALTLAQAPFTINQIDLGKGEHMTAAYLAINPFGKVPALQHETGVLTEGLALHAYLNAKYPEAGLIPTDTDLQYTVYKWLSVVYGTSHAYFTQLFMPNRFATDAEEVKANAIKGLRATFALIAQQLEKNHFIAGDTITAADLYLVVQLYWLASAGLTLEQQDPVLANYRQRIEQHPIVGAVYRAEFGR